ncbi:hypothetical protein IWZ03DRAFT_124273 [Phyllosticta citriasiana]|uniref:Uncharacterized protein n=1 Tax=Phyllosticta citriasiana TaxID=595635 RepID=A0ABR1KS19_9PEZI
MAVTEDGTTFLDRRRKSRVAAREKDGIGTEVPRWVRVGWGHGCLYKSVERQSCRRLRAPSRCLCGPCLDLLTTGDLTRLARRGRLQKHPLPPDCMSARRPRFSGRQVDLQHPLRSNSERASALTKIVGTRKASASRALGLGCATTFRIHDVVDVALGCRDDHLFVSHLCFSELEAQPKAPSPAGCRCEHATLRSAPSVTMQPGSCVEIV